MAANTYTTKAVVLRKTKLGESDLILTLLAEDGSQIRAVAKGARKPSSSFSSRLELYSIADLLCCTGRSLDIVKEARLIAGNERLRTDIEFASAAAPMAELLDRITQLGLTDTQLFAMTSTALDSLCRVSAANAPLITAAHLLKTFAFSGIKPSMLFCVSCGSETDLAQTEKQQRVSYAEGGVLCDRCAPDFQTVAVDTELCKWVQLLLGSRFSQIETLDDTTQAAFAILHFCQSWTREHVGANLKSLNFMFTSGLY